MLYLISTPIGNLADFSHRAVDILGKCDYVLCEDTRHSRVLLDHYRIAAPLKSFHSFNEAKMEDLVVSDLKAGRTIALISDAGTPLISDPGQDLVVRCREENLPVTAIPGPCAVIDALVLSGFPAQPFQFLGFLPKKEKELQETLARALFYRGTTIAYESPHRIEETLQQIPSERTVAVARELTKLYEEVLTGTPLALLEHFKQHPPRGEIVLLIAPPRQQILLEEFSLEELVEMLQKDFNLSKTEAIKMAASLRQMPKKEVYKRFSND